MTKHTAKEERERAIRVNKIFSELFDREDRYTETLDIITAVRNVKRGNVERRL